MKSGVSWRSHHMVLQLTLTVFDTADGTLPRLLQVPLKPTNITRIFITHMHADHVLGVVEILLAALYPPDLGEPSRPSGSKGTVS